MSKFVPRISYQNPPREIPNDLTEKFSMTLRTGDLDQVKNFLLSNNLALNLLTSGAKEDAVSIVLSLTDDVAGPLEKYRLLDFLKQNGASFDYPDHNNARPLHHAARMQNKKIVELILSTNPNIGSTDSSGNTPLHYAVRGSATPCPKPLSTPLALNADIVSTQTDHTDTIKETIKWILDQINKKSTADLNPIINGLLNIPDTYKGSEYDKNLDKEIIEALTTISTSDTFDSQSVSKQQHLFDTIAAKNISIFEGDIYSSAVTNLDIHPNNSGWGPAALNDATPMSLILPETLEDIAKSFEKERLSNYKNFFNAEGLKITEGVFKSLEGPSNDIMTLVFGRGDDIPKPTLYKVLYLLMYGYVLKKQADMIPEYIADTYSLVTKEQFFGDDLDNIEDYVLYGRNMKKILEDIKTNNAINDPESPLYQNTYIKYMDVDRDFDEDAMNEDIINSFTKPLENITLPKLIDNFLKKNGDDNELENMKKITAKSLNNTPEKIISDTFREIIKSPDFFKNRAGIPAPLTVMHIRDFFKAIGMNDGDIVNFVAAHNGRHQPTDPNPIDWRTAFQHIDDESIIKFISRQCFGNDDHKDIDLSDNIKTPSFANIFIIREYLKNFIESNNPFNLSIHPDNNIFPSILQQKINIWIWFANNEIGHEDALKKMDVFYSIIVLMLRIKVKKILKKYTIIAFSEDSEFARNHPYTQQPFDNDLYTLLLPPIENADNSSMLLTKTGKIKLTDFNDFIKTIRKTNKDLVDLLLTFFQSFYDEYIDSRKPLGTYILDKVIITKDPYNVLKNNDKNADNFDQNIVFDLIINTKGYANVVKKLFTDSGVKKSYMEMILEHNNPIGNDKLKYLINFDTSRINGYLMSTNKKEPIKSYDYSLSEFMLIYMALFLRRTYELYFMTNEINKKIVVIQNEIDKGELNLSQIIQKNLVSFAENVILIVQTIHEYKVRSKKIIEQYEKTLAAINLTAKGVLELRTHFSHFNTSIMQTLASMHANLQKCVEYHNNVIKYVANLSDENRIKNPSNRFFTGSFPTLLPFPSFESYNSFADMKDMLKNYTINDLIYYDSTGPNNAITRGDLLRINGNNIVKGPGIIGVVNKIPADINDIKSEKYQLPIQESFGTAFLMKSKQKIIQDTVDEILKDSTDNVYKKLLQIGSISNDNDSSIQKIKLACIVAKLTDNAVIAAMKMAIAQSVHRWTEQKIKSNANRTSQKIPIKDIIPKTWFALTPGKIEQQLLNKFTLSEPELSREVVEEKPSKPTYFDTMGAAPTPEDFVAYLYNLNYFADNTIGTDTMASCFKINKKIIELLISPLSLNAQNVEGMTPLHYAMQMHNPTIAKILTDKGAIKDKFRNKRGLSPVDLINSDITKHLSMIMPSTTPKLDTVLDRFAAPFNKLLEKRLLEPKFNGNVIKYFKFAIPIQLCMYQHMFATFIHNYRLGIDQRLQSKLNVFMGGNGISYPYDLVADINVTELIKFYDPNYLGSRVEQKRNERKIKILKEQKKEYDTQIEELDNIPKPIDSDTDKLINELKQKRADIEKEIQKLGGKTSDKIPPQPSILGVAFDSKINDAQNTPLQRSWDLPQFYDTIFNKIVLKKRAHLGIWIQYMQKDLSKAPSMIISQFDQRILQNVDKTIPQEFYDKIEKFVKYRTDLPNELDSNPALMQEYIQIKYICQLILTPAIVGLIYGEIQKTLVEIMPDIDEAKMNSIMAAIDAAKYGNYNLRKYIDERLPSIAYKFFTKIYNNRNDPDSRLQESELFDPIIAIINSNDQLIFDEVSSPFVKYFRDYLVPFMSNTYQNMIHHLRLSIFGYEKYLMETAQMLKLATSKF